jgi:hypothetical protein
MQARFLGDAKDSFKWHCHNYLASRLALPRLSIALMMNPDGANTHGRTRPEEFPADPRVLEFCRDLRRSKDVEGIKSLPERTGAHYEVRLHRGSELLSNQSRTRYFADLDASCDQLVLLDPDNGFEPEKSCTTQHVRYEDVRQVLDQLTEGSEISVFQHFRYVPFADDYARISERLGSCHSTAIHWDALMFVAVTRSQRTLDRVRAANRDYADAVTVVTVIP